MNSETNLREHCSFSIIISRHARRINRIIETQICSNACTLLYQLKTKLTMIIHLPGVIIH